MNDPKNPVPGEMNIDASDIDPIDITSEQIQELTKVRDGVKTAVDNVLNAKSADIDRAGINDKDLQRLAAALAEDKRIAVLLPAAEKMVELLHEKRQLRRHEIGTLLGEMASQVRRRAERSVSPAEVLGPFAELLDYQYGPGMKGAATKAKAKAAKAKAKAKPEAVPAADTEPAVAVK